MRRSENKIWMAEKYNVPKHAITQPNFCNHENEGVSKFFWEGDGPGELGGVTTGHKTRYTYLKHSTGAKGAAPHVSTQSRKTFVL